MNTKDEFHFVPDSYRRAQYGYPNAYLGVNMRYAIEGEKGAVLRSGGEEYDIKVRMDEGGRDSVEDVKSYRYTHPTRADPSFTAGRVQKDKGYLEALSL